MRQNQTDIEARDEKARLSDCGRETLFDDSAHDVRRRVELRPGFKLCRRLADEHLDAADSPGAAGFGLLKKLGFGRIVDRIEDDGVGAERRRYIAEWASVDIGMHANA